MRSRSTLRGRTSSGVDGRPPGPGGRGTPAMCSASMVMRRLTVARAVASFTGATGLTGAGVEGDSMASARAAVVGAALALGGLAGEARAQDGPRVALLTMAPGEHPFVAFGHSALWIHDPRLQGEDVDLVYNFGTFAFGSPRVVVDFARGQLSYWLSFGPLDWTLSTYGAEGRTVRAQELALSPDEIDRLERALLIGARPENRAYAYGYIDHNCATRLRDALDQATGGAMRAALAGPGPGVTYRREIARVLGAHPALGEAVDAVLGPSVDRAIGPWEAAFLPDRLAQGLARGRRAGPPGAGAGGADRPVVTSERTLVERGRWFADRPAPDRRAGALGVGAAGAVALALAGRRGARALGVLVATVGGAI
ncbi:MAG: DUF4105 domain-containing protein, partial [Myxococcales bacterium]